MSETKGVASGLFQSQSQRKQKQSATVISYDYIVLDAHKSTYFPHRTVFGFSSVQSMDFLYIGRRPGRATT